MDRSLDWKEIETLISIKSIDQLYERAPISHEQLEADVNLLKTIVPQEYLNAEQTIDYIGLGLSELYEFEQFGAVSPNGWRLKLLHVMCEMLRSIEHIDGFNSFKKKFKSNEGMFNQLCATCYFQAFTDVEAIESIHKGIDADIVINMNNTVILVHVKTINQKAKSRKLFEFYGKLSSSVGRRSRSNSGRSLGILLLDGVVPAHLPDKQAIELIEGIPAEPGHYELDLGGGYKVIVELDWTSEGQIVGPDSFRNFNYHLMQVEQNIELSDEYMNVLVGTLGGYQSIKTIQPRPDAFESCRLDAVFFLIKYTNTNSFIFERTPIFSRTTRREFASSLEDASPQKFWFPRKR